ncbi:MAG: hypothetical protein ACLSUM_15490 [Dysosmobacter welbionis]
MDRFSGLGKEEGWRTSGEECGVAFTPGREFGSGCGTFMRVNLACRRALMLEAFRRIEAALKNETGGSPFHLKRASCPSCILGGTFAGYRMENAQIDKQKMLFSKM